MHFSLFEYNFVYLSLAYRTKRYQVSKYSFTTFSLEGDFLRAWLIFTTWQAIPFKRKFYYMLLLFDLYKDETGINNKSKILLMCIFISIISVSIWLEILTSISCNNKLKHKILFIYIIKLETVTPLKQNNYNISTIMSMFISSFL